MFSWPENRACSFLARSFFCNFFRLSQSISPYSLVAYKGANLGIQLKADF